MLRPTQGSRTKRLPRERRPDERPQELLDAALRVFADRGFQITTLDEVAQAAGVTKGAIYHYFDGKEALLRQALTARIGAIFSGIEAESNRGHATSAERLRATLRAAWKRWTSPETARMYRLLTGEVRVLLPDLHQASLRAGPLNLKQLVAAILGQGKRRGEFHTRFDVELVAGFIVSGLMHQGLSLAEDTTSHHATADEERVFDEALVLVLRGLASKTGDASRASAHPRRSKRTATRV